MPRLLILFLLSGCAGAMTADERFEHEYREAHRVEFFQVWADACGDLGYTIIQQDVTSRCLRRSNCVPHRNDWDFVWSDSEDPRTPVWRARPTNQVVCVDWH